MIEIETRDRHPRAITAESRQDSAVIAIWFVCHPLLWPMAMKVIC